MTLAKSYIKPVSQVQSLAAFLAAILLGTWTVGCTGDKVKDPQQPAKSISIPLNRSVLREPLVNLVLPGRKGQKVESSARSQNSNLKTVQDSVRFGELGMLVVQPANPDGAGRVTGFKLLAPASGDFEVKLTCRILRLDQPTENGRHGLVLRFRFRDGISQLVTFGCMSSRDCERCLVRRVLREGEEIPQSVVPLDFSAGTWSVRRHGGQLSVVVQSESGETVASDTVNGVHGVLDSTEIWCTRLPHGSGYAEIELREVSISAAGLFPMEPERVSYLFWIQLGLGVVAAVSSWAVYKSSG